MTRCIEAIKLRSPERAERLAGHDPLGELVGLPLTTGLSSRNESFATEADDFVLVVREHESRRHVHVGALVHQSVERKLDPLVSEVSDVLESRWDPGWVWHRDCGDTV